MSIVRPMKRRRTLPGVGVAAAGAASSVAFPWLVFARNLMPMTFTLPWASEESNRCSYVAKGMRFRRKHGPDVGIARGLGSVAAARAIGSGRFNFRMAAPPAAILKSVKGLGLMPLAFCAYDATVGIGVLNASSIRLYSEYGTPDCGTTILTQPDRAANEPELCVAVVDGMPQELNATQFDPKDAIMVFFKQAPQMARAAQSTEQIPVGTGIMTFVGPARRPQDQGDGIHRHEGLCGND